MEKFRQYRYDGKKEPSFLCEFYKVFSRYVNIYVRCLGYLIMIAGSWRLAVDAGGRGQVFLRQKAFMQQLSHSALRAVQTARPCSTSR